MIKPSITIVVLSTALCFAGIAAEKDAEESVSLEKIPPAAAKALREHAGGAKITGVSQEKDEGRMVYEASFTSKGRAHDVTVDKAGKLVSDEEVVPIGEAPKAVKAAIEREIPGGKVEKFERIKEGGKVSYEELISAKGKREEIKFDSAGKVLEREDKTGKKEKD